MSSFKKNALLVVCAQAIVLVVSVLKSLLIPKLLGVDEFGYWQVYVLYSGFVGVFSLGFSDGVYLLYAGLDYEKLPFQKLRGMTRLNIALLAFFSISVCLLSLLIVDEMKSRAFLFVGLDILAVCLSGLFLYVLQITGRFRSFSFFSTFDKVIVLAMIALVVMTGAIDPVSFMVIDCISKYVVAGLLCFRCRDLIMGMVDSLPQTISDYLSTVKVGASLLFANLAGMFAVNMGRFIVELFGGLSEYAYYSFGISITNLVLTFVTAVSTVVYPSLKRLDDSKLPSYFNLINHCVRVASLVGLIFCVPAELLIKTFFENYTPLIQYLPWLFLSVVGQVKMQLLNNTYYKALRMEARLLRANLEGIALMILFGGFGYYFTRDVSSVAAATAATMLLRSWISEGEISKRLGVRSAGSIVCEVVFCLLYIVEFSLLGESVGLFGQMMVPIVALMGALLYKKVGKRA